MKSAPCQMLGCHGSNCCRLRLVVHAWLSAGPDGSLMGSWSAVGLDKSLTLLARLFCFVLFCFGAGPGFFAGSRDSQFIPNRPSRYSTAEFFTLPVVGDCYRSNLAVWMSSNAKSVAPISMSSQIVLGCWCATLWLSSILVSLVMTSDELG